MKVGQWRGCRHHAYQVRIPPRSYATELMLPSQVTRFTYHRGLAWSSSLTRPLKPSLSFSWLLQRHAFRLLQPPNLYPKLPSLMTLAIFTPWFKPIIPSDGCYMVLHQVHTIPWDLCCIIIGLLKMASGLPRQSAPRHTSAHLSYTNDPNRECGLRAQKLVHACGWPILEVNREPRICKPALLCSWGSRRT